MVLADNILECLCNSDEYKSRLNETIGENVRDTWEDELFYVKRFYCGNEKYFEVDCEDENDS